MEKVFQGRSYSLKGISEEEMQIFKEALTLMIRETQNQQAEKLLHQLTKPKKNTPRPSPLLLKNQLSLF